MVRTKSGRMIEKTILVSKEEYEELQRITQAGGDPTTVCICLRDSFICLFVLYYITLFIGVI